MLRAAYLLALAILLGLTGCVQLAEREYYHPMPPEPCQVPIKVDGAWRYCVSREHAQRILRDLTP